MKNMSIRRRLLISLLSLIIVTCALALIKNYFDTKTEIHELMDAQLAQAARVLLKLSAHELYEQLAFQAQNNEKQLNRSEHDGHINVPVHKYQQDIAFQIWTADGRLASHSSNAPLTQLINKDKLFATKMINGERWRVYSISNDEETLRVQVGELHDKRQNLSDGISVQLIASFSIIIPFLAILIFITVGRAMEPLRRIAHQIENRKFTNLKMIDTQDVCQEALPMVSALNALFKRLQNSFEEITLFTSNAAHELRSPLAAQRIHTQLALKTNDHKQRVTALQEVLSSIDRATHMVDQLLTLARLDPQTFNEFHERTDLYLIVEEQLSEMGAEAIEKQIELSLEAKIKPQVTGQSRLVAVLIRNLVENAIRYTPQGGSVNVLLYLHQSIPCFSIEDSGPGIAEDQYHNVFKRFYRIENCDQGGTGLGLAMVKRVVEILGASIHLGRASLGGLRVDVHFEADKIKEADHKVL